MDAEHRTEAAPNGESDPLMQETPSGAFAAPDPKDHAPPSAAAIKDAKQAGRLPYVVPPSLSPQDNNERREGTMPVRRLLPLAILFVVSSLFFVFC